MRILFLTDNFPPEVNAPASRTMEHCREWVKLGFQVTVVTCAPNFPEGIVYPGYRNNFWSKASVDGVDVVRVWTFIAPNAGFFLRTLDQISFCFAAVIASFFIKKPDLVVATSPQFFTAFAGYAISILKRRPWVFELRDIWPASLVAVGALRSKKIIRILEKIELFLYRNADHIVVVTNEFKKILTRQGIEANKISIVTNGVDINQFFPREKDRELSIKYDLSEKFVVGYIGTLGMAHALETLIDVADLFWNSTRSRDVVFLVVGSGASKEALTRRTASAALGNVVFIDPVTKSDVPRYWSVLDAAVIHLKKDDVFKSVIPSKLFEAMAMGIPVLMGVEGEAASIVESHGVGLLFEPENSKSLEQVVLKLGFSERDRKRFTENGPQAAKKFFSRQALAVKMSQIMLGFTRQ